MPPLAADRVRQSRSVTLGFSIVLGILLGVAIVWAGTMWWRSDRPAQAREVAGGTVDVGFLQHMAQHHDQAVVMAGIVAGRASPQITALATQITHNQLLEVGEMRGWLKMWQRPLLPQTSSMAWMNTGQGQSWTPDQAYARLCSGSGGMPGMATSAELNRLRAASGKSLDILFLQLMLRHHLSAISMARFADRNAETPMIASAATLMAREQSEEAATIRTLLRQADAEPLPFPEIEIEVTRPPR
ncbi:Uncharacterized conserved protein, DUF305 family [Novosphingobium sp. CF614]|nr:Uncharacterized conserved protein, DUF305 family [Novosphingobium sp. CF614]